MLRSTLSQEFKAKRLLFCFVVDAGLTGVMVCCCDCKYRHQCKTEPDHASESQAGGRAGDKIILVNVSFTSS